MENHQRYIFIDNQAIPVTEEVYRAYVRPIWREQKRLERDGRCCVNGIRCMGDCSHCPHERRRMVLSLDQMMEEGFEPADPSADVEDILEGRMLLEALFRRLEELDPDGQLLCQLLMDGKSERQIAAQFGISQVAVHKRKQKVFGLLREALDR